jgi:hypothetical protein
LLPQSGSPIPLGSSSLPSEINDIVNGKTSATPSTAAPKSAPSDERGIKAPQKRNFERATDKDIRDFFSYRFDQLRSEMKAAQNSGDQGAVADVQRRMNELDQIQRTPRAKLQDIFNGQSKSTSAGK